MSFSEQKVVQDVEPFFRIFLHDPLRFCLFNLTAGCSNMFGLLNSCWNVAFSILLCHILKLHKLSECYKSFLIHETPWKMHFCFFSLSSFLGCMILCCRSKLRLDEAEHAKSIKEEGGRRKSASVSIRINEQRGIRPFTSASYGENIFCPLWV